MAVRAYKDCLYSNKVTKFTAVNFGKLVKFSKPQNTTSLLVFT